MLILVLMVAINFSSFSNAHGGEENEHSGGWIQDVIIIDIECENNQTCVYRPSNIVEYFGSDNCEPCIPVEEQLRERNNDSVFIISHHPSPVDEFWLPESRIRFQQVYSLWGYPDLIIDGHYLLAGKSQANELESVISNSTARWSGIQSVSMNNSNLTVSHNIENGTLDVWTVGQYDDFENMALNYSNLSEPYVDTNGDYLVVILSSPGEVKLITGSSLPSSGYEPDMEGVKETFEESSNDTFTIIIILILLTMIFAPQLTKLWPDESIIKEDKD